MGHGFGQLAKIRGVIFYRLSPFEQRAFAGALSKGFPNTIRRISENFWRVAPPFIISYVVYNETEKLHAKMLRKNPEDYACDE
jgi:ubiquinol-cytochrome c reductase subunit 8